MNKPAFSRILLKLSGEVLAGDKEFGIDPQKAKELASEIKVAHDMGTVSYTHLTLPTIYSV